MLKELKNTVVNTKTKKQFRDLIEEAGEFIN